MEEEEEEEEEEVASAAEEDVAAAAVVASLLPLSLFVSDVSVVLDLSLDLSLDLVDDDDDDDDDAPPATGAFTAPAADLPVFFCDFAFFLPLAACFRRGLAVRVDVGRRR